MIKSPFPSFPAKSPSNGTKRHANETVKENIEEMGCCGCNVVTMRRGHLE